MDTQPANSSARGTATRMLAGRDNEVSRIAGAPGHPGGSHERDDAPLAGVHRLERQGRGREVVTGTAGQRQAEVAPVSRFAPRLQPAAVQMRVLEGNGQAEPR